MPLIIFVIIFFITCSFDSFAFDCSSLKDSWRSRIILKDKYKKITNMDNYNLKYDDNIKAKLIANDVIYQEYINQLFFNEINAIPCNNIKDDPLIKLINLYALVDRKIMNIDRFSEIMLKEQNSILAFMELDDIVSGDKVLFSKWLAKYRATPNFDLVNRLTNAFTSKNRHVIIYFLKLLDTSDGCLAEFMYNKVVIIFMRYHEEVILNYDKLEKFKSRITGFFCDYLSIEDRLNMIRLYQGYNDNKNAKEILKWLLCSKKNSNE